jgi:hypothetical protein
VLLGQPGVSVYEAAAAGVSAGSGVRKGLLFSEEKRSKKDFPTLRRGQVGKVFWFFFSKKNALAYGTSSSGAEGL